MRVPIASGALCVSICVACTSDTASEPRAQRRHHSEPDAAAADGGDALDAQLTPDSPSQPALCARERDDVIHDLFCGDTPPAIASLLDLLTL